MQAESHEHPTNIQNLLMLGNADLQMQRTNEAVALFDQALTNPALTYNEAAAIAQEYSKFGYGDLDKLGGRAPKTRHPRARTNPAGGVLRPRRAQGRDGEHQRSAR